MNRLHIAIPKNTPTNKDKIISSFKDTSVFIFDFDQTLTKDHIYHLLDSEKTQLEDLGAPPYKDKEVCKNLKELFEYLYKNNKTILIASRNFNDVIYYYIRQNVYPHFSLMNIFTDRHWFFNKEIIKVDIKNEGKFKCLKILKELGVPAKSILYVDDNYQEIRIARELYSDIQYYWKDSDEILSLEWLNSIFNKE